MLNIHPLVVHFPIALLISATALLALGVVRRSELLVRCARLNLWLGALGAAAAVRTGLLAEDTVQHSFEIHQLMERHELFGLWTMWLAIVLSAACLVAPVVSSRRLQIALLACLFGVSTAMGFGAHLGGRMVYEMGVGTSLVTQGGALRSEHQHTEPAPQAHEHHH